jgi:colanic acid biosynthesis protein WcaH
MLLPDHIYQTIINNSVNLCTDIFLYHNDKMLLVRRTQEPCKGIFWPIGGRIHKGETAEQASRRKIKEEIGIDFRGLLLPIGFYEDQYTSNSFIENTHYHTLSIVFRGQIDDISNISLDKTSDDYDFFDNMPSIFKLQKFEK